MKFNLPIGEDCIEMFYMLYLRFETDEEIGNEFLTPWKSTTAGDDALDFSCETVPDGRKKPFDFVKL